MRIYVDTSVFGGCLEPEFELASRRLFARFRAGEDRLVISDITIAELERAPQPVQDVLGDIPVGFVERWAVLPEAEALADRYLEEGVIPVRMKFDAQHIAVATIAAVDVLVSWNFKHIVNLQRIRGYNTVNASLGYPPVEIRTPQEVGANDG
jgi:predicted nucleic acid-binding protein